jgi:hypothetical protein
VALWALSKIWSRGGMPGEHPAEEEAQPKGRV